MNFLFGYARFKSIEVVSMITENHHLCWMQIQPTIVHFQQMLASVLQLDVEIVDDKLTRIAGTGLF